MGVSIVRKQQISLNIRCKQVTRFLLAILFHKSELKNSFDIGGGINPCENYWV